MDKVLDYFSGFEGTKAYLAIFVVLLLCGLGVPVPEDITLVAAGYLAHLGNIHFWPALAVGFFGVMIGDSFMFFLGAKYGRALTKKWIFAKLLPPERLNEMSRQLRRRGKNLIFAARFMPGFRAAIFFSAGTLHLPFRVFIIYDGLAAILSVPAIVSAAFYFGHVLDLVIKTVRKVQHGIIIVLVLLLVFWITKRLVSRSKVPTP